jgi:DeoR family glycerol-3-phosphate regulon repressor
MPVISMETALANGELSERQARILETVQERGYATIEQLSTMFEVSAQTIRREVIRLDSAGLLQRFHGGAGVSDDSIRLSYRHKQEVAVGPKARIGQAIADLIPDDASVFLDVGTTLESVATALRGRRLGVICTNSMSAAAILGASCLSEVYVTGGLVRGNDGSLVGDTASKALAPISVDYAVIGCSGFAPDGSPTDFDPQKVAVKQTAISNARNAIIAADSSKFGRAALMQIAPLLKFNALVSDRAPLGTLRQNLRDANVEIRIATAAPPEALARAGR